MDNRFRMVSQQLDCETGILRQEMLWRDRVGQEEQVLRFSTQEYRLYAPSIVQSFHWEESYKDDSFWMLATWLGCTHSWRVAEDVCDTNDLPLTTWWWKECRGVVRERCSEAKICKPQCPNDVHGQGCCIKCTVLVYPPSPIRNIASDTCIYVVHVQKG